MDMKNMEKLDALQNSATFELGLEKVNTAEEMQHLLNNHGVEMTLDEIRDMVKHAVEMNDELTEDDLQFVAGGFAWAAVGKWALKVIASWAIGKILDEITGW